MNFVYSYKYKLSCICLNYMYHKCLINISFYI